MRDNGATVLERLEKEGIEFRLLDDQIRFRPRNLSTDQLNLLNSYKDEIRRLLEVRQRREPKGDRLDTFRSYVPRFWEPFRTSDGRCGLFYGITPNGIMLLIGAVVHCFEPSEVEPL